MFNTPISYIRLIVLHVILGFLVFKIPFIAKVYPFIILVVGFLYVINNKNRNDEVLFVCAYIVGIEVFFRMLKGNPLYEFSKYAVILFIFIGMYYKGFAKGGGVYWVFLLLLIPSVIIGTQVLDVNAAVRKTISFNISGPVCLGFASLYTFQREMSFKRLNDLLLCIGAPIVSCVTYLFFFSPNIKEVIIGTSSNSSFSGGFGPNQVATILGLGMFIFFSRLIFDSKTKLLFVVNLLLAFYITYRGMITFSRGGMFTGFFMVMALLLQIFINLKSRGKLKLIIFFSILIVTMSLIWTYTSYQTNGMIDNRYANKDALGREKKDRFTGRGELAEGELNMFLENPFFGVGVAKGSELRARGTGRENLVASHAELTRMLAEHGMLGIIALMILFITPLFLFYDNRQHIYLLSFMIFWFLSINHAAMRTAAPAFVYSLSLLKVRFDKNEDTIHRE